MNKETLKSKLDFVATKQVGIEMYLLCNNAQENTKELLRMNLEGSETKSKLEGAFIGKIKTQLLNFVADPSEMQAAEWEIKHINDVAEDKKLIYYFKSDEEDFDFDMPEEFVEMARLSKVEYEKVPLFKHEEHSIESVVAYLIRLKIDSEQVILYKHKYPIDVLTKSMVFKVLNVAHNSQFRLEKEPLIKLSDKIDFLFIDETFVILNLGLLESRFKFNDRYLKVADKSLQFIKSKKILVDTAKLEELSKTVSFAKKLMKVKQDNEVLKTPIATIKNFLDSYKTKDGKLSLAKRIKYNARANKFEVTSNVGAEDFLRLLHDQYLISLLTSTPYIADNPTEFLSDNEEQKSKPAKKKRSTTVES